MRSRTRRGVIVLRRKWSRRQVEAQLTNLPPCRDGMDNWTQESVEWTLSSAGLPHLDFARSWIAPLSVGTHGEAQAESGSDGKANQPQKRRLRCRKNA